MLETYRMSTGILFNVDFCEIFSSESIFTQKCTVLLWFYYHISFYSHLLWPPSY